MSAPMLDGGWSAHSVRISWQGNCRLAKWEALTFRVETARGANQPVPNTAARSVTRSKRTLGPASLRVDQVI